MSWLSELKWSNRLEHLYAMIAGDEELDETVPSTYDRRQGFLYKIAQKIAELSEGGGGGVDDIGIATTEDGFELTEEMTIAEVYNRVVNGARFCVSAETDGVSAKYYLGVQSATRVDSPERYVIEIRALDSQSIPPLYVYNEVGSNEVVISENVPS